jgi:hypothetical protein
LAEENLCIGLKYKITFMGIFHKHDYEVNPETHNILIYGTKPSFQPSFGLQKN